MKPNNELFLQTQRNTFSFFGVIPVLKYHMTTVV